MQSVTFLWIRDLTIKDMMYYKLLVSHSIISPWMTEENDV